MAARSGPAAAGAIPSRRARPPRRGPTPRPGGRRRPGRQDRPGRHDRRGSTAPGVTCGNRASWSGAPSIPEDVAARTSTGPPRRGRPPREASAPGWPRPAPIGGQGSGDPTVSGRANGEGEAAGDDRGFPGRDCGRRIEDGHVRSLRGWDGPGWGRGRGRSPDIAIEQQPGVDRAGLLASSRLAISSRRRRSGPPAGARRSAPAPARRRRRPLARQGFRWRPPWPRGPDAPHRPAESAGAAGEPALVGNPRRASRGTCRGTHPSRRAAVTAEIQTGSFAPGIMSTSSGASARGADRARAEPWPPNPGPTDRYPRFFERTGRLRRIILQALATSRACPRDRRDRVPRPGALVSTRIVECVKKACMLFFRLNCRAHCKTLIPYS